MSIEILLNTYSFAKEVILLVIGVVLGGICTIILNNGAIRKQAKFNMQYRILSTEAKDIDAIYKKIEAIEIALSFGDGETKALENNINEVQYLLLALNERLRNKRTFVRKYMSAVIVEKSAKLVLTYTNILYTIDGSDIFDFEMIEKVNAEKIKELREFESNFREFNNQITEAMESLIEPSILSRIKRKLLKIGMTMEECNAIRKVYKRNTEEK